MQRMMIDRAKELLASGQVSRVLGWEQGEHSWDRTPAFFDGGNIENLKYDGFCGPNVSKYLVAEAAKEGTVLAFLKPCDSWSFNQLATEHRINTDKVYAIGVGCRGKIDVEKIRANAPVILEKYRAGLYARMKEILQDTQIEETRILQEAALYSDKICVDEEMVRLESHIRAVRAELRKNDESVGRKLDFLAQELNREANTILSKTDNAESADIAIGLKTEIEKIREQIQNLE